MIPKTIHYCWFGCGEKPNLVKKCIESWRKYCPDYKIIEWNEDNFDVNCCLYVRQAYEAKKYAFVSDYVRLSALYNFGGIYMDTDVEVLKSFDTLLNHRCIFGFEEKEYVATSFMACEVKNIIINEYLNMYNNEIFKKQDGSLNTYTNVNRLTYLLEHKGLKRNNEKQKFDEIVVYPKEYFSPYDYINCIDERTENSYCIHWFYVSWMSKREQIKKIIKRLFVKYFGKQKLENIRGMLKK